MRRYIIGFSLALILAVGVPALGQWGILENVAAWLAAEDGTAAAPSHTFASDPDTGAYRVSANTYGISAGGTKKVQVDADGLTVGNTGLHIEDTNASHDLILKPGSDLSADRQLTFTTGDAARTVTLSGDLNVEASSNINQDLTTDASVSFEHVASTDDAAVAHQLTVKQINMTPVCTIADGDATPSVADCGMAVTSSNTAPTAITDLDNPVVGQLITICGGSNTNSSTIADSGNFALDQAYTASLDLCLTLYVQADNDYVEVSRTKGFAGDLLGADLSDSTDSIVTILGSIVQGSATADTGTFTMIKGAQVGDPQVQMALTADGVGAFSVTTSGGTDGDITLSPSGGEVHIGADDSAKNVEIHSGGTFKMWDASDDTSVTLDVDNGTTELDLTGDLSVSSDVDVTDTLTCGDLVVDEAAGAIAFTGATSARVYGPVVTGDVAAPTMTVEASDASSTATTAGNLVGGSQILLAGLGRKQIVIDSYADCAGGHIHVIYGDAATPDTLTTSAAMTQGVEWACATDNATCAGTLAAYLDSLDYMSAAADGATVQITPAAGVSYMEFTDSTGAACMTITSSNNGINYIGGRVRLGKPGTPATYTKNGDVYFGGDVELDGAYGLTAYSSIVSEAGNFTVGASGMFGGSASPGGLPSFRPHLTANTPDTGAIATGSIANSILICEAGDITFDFQHALSTNPILIGHSANQSTTEFWSLTHDQTDAVLSSGAGNVKLTPKGALSVWPQALAADTAPATAIINGQNPYQSPATVPLTNRNGANIVLAPGQGLQVVGEIVPATVAGKTITLTTTAKGVVAAGVTKTEGVASPDGFACATLTAAECALNMLTLLNGAGAVSGCAAACIDGTCSNGQIAIGPVTGTSERCVFTTNDSTAFPLTAGNQGVDGYVKVPGGSATAPGVTFPGGYGIYSDGSNVKVSSGAAQLVQFGATQTSIDGSFVAGTTYYIGLSGRSRFYSPASGYLRVTNNENNGPGAWVGYPQTITCADNGTGDPSDCGGAQTISSNVVMVNCADAHGCTLTLAETNYSATVAGNVIIHAGPTQTGQLTLADSSGVVELGGGTSWTPAAIDTLCLSYSPALHWAECGRSDNTP